MTDTITNQDDIIDSRDIIERIEELEEEEQALIDAVEEAKEAMEEAFGDIEESGTETAAIGQGVVRSRKSFLAEIEAKSADLLKWDGHEELRTLKALADEAEPESRDWIHGEALIRRSYWVQYVEDLIHDCYSMPKEMRSGEWPFRHMTMDYEAAAQELESDYASVDFDGVEYLIRSC